MHDIKEKFWVDFREGRPIAPDVIAELNKYPTIDWLRSSVRDEDIPLLIRSAGKDDACHLLALGLHHGKTSDPRVKQLMFELWQTKDSFDLRYFVSSRLLDYADLSIEIHTDIYMWVRETWDKWLSQTVEWSSGTNVVLDTVRKRLLSSSFPKTKAWVYLCASIGSPYKAEVKELLIAYSDDHHSIGAQVAKDLLKMIDRPNGGPTF